MSLPLSDLRTAVLARMVTQQPAAKPLGRTAVMKLFYFLQELKGAPLGYDFRLFTYGPYDADVLSDLSEARSSDTVVEKLISFGHGYGYEITKGPKAERCDQKLTASAPEIARMVDDVVTEFGQLSASELELRSTNTIVDREFNREGFPADAQAIAERVHAVKPHFPVATILVSIEKMEPYLLTLAADDISF